MDEENIEPQNNVAVEEVVENIEEVNEEIQEPIHEREEKQVPLSALQRERRKRQELEAQLELQRQKSTPQEEDLSRYESATKADLELNQRATIRQIEEKLWIKNNPEKYEKINTYLPEFLKKRPNLAHAIETSENRYEEAYELMEALTPKEQRQMKEVVQKREAPNSPNIIPKAANVNQAIDVMSMTDKEFSEWRNAQKRKR